MARGRPALWGTLLGLSFGLVAYLVLSSPRYPRLVAVPLLAVGAAAFVGGLFLRAAAPSPPRMRAGESLVTTRHPHRVGTYVRLLTSALVLAVSAYSYAFTSLHAAIPAGGGVLGTYLFGRGLYFYWRTSLRTYYLTDRRLISAYRFLSLERTEIPLDEIAGIQEHKSIPEMLIGSGNVRVASGGSDTLEIELRRIPRPSRFVRQLRTLVVERSRTNLVSGETRTE